MQKQRIVDYVEDARKMPAPEMRPALRLVTGDEVDVVSPARRLQDDIAQAFSAEAAWSVKRTVIAGVAFHAVVLGSLGLAAGSLILHLTR
jgi:uncharacterized protein (DUF2342 family)